MYLPDVETPPADQLILASELRNRGTAGGRLDAAVRAGTIVRVHRGVYLSGTPWESLPPDERYRLRIRAVAITNPRRLMFCHESAAALHRLPLVTPWPDTVHVATPEAPGGSSQAAIIAHTRANAGEFVILDSLVATSLSRTVIGLAAKGPFSNAVAVVDAALRRWGDSYREVLATEFEAAALRRGLVRARRAIEFGDGRADSAGESLSRARIHELGFAMPELQVAFETNGHRYLVDYFWPDANVIGEFDGRAKYSRDEFTVGSPPEEIVWREKKREDALRAATGARVDRRTWATAMDGSALGRLLVAAGVPRIRSEAASSPVAPSAPTRTRSFRAP